jgi:hypothetical protein
MTAPTYWVLNGDGGSNLPALPDAACEFAGGLYFADSVTKPPRTHEHPSAKDFMQMERALYYAYQMLPLVTIWVSVNGSGTPTINEVRSATTNVTAANITPARSDVGTYTFTLPASSLPSNTTRIKCGALNVAGLIATGSRSGAVISMLLTTHAGVATDTGAFWIDVYGI